MSDYEESNSENTSSDSDEEDFNQTVKDTTKHNRVSAPTTDIYNNDDDDEIEDDEDDEVIDGDDYDDNDIKKGGGIKSQSYTGGNDDDEDDENSDDQDQDNYPADVDEEEDDSDDDNEDDTNYLQKFDTEISKNYVAEFHPECFHHNYSEISALTNIIRDHDNVIIDPCHKTLPFLTKYERARVLGQRAKQIECGGTPFIALAANIIEPHIIAELELAAKKIPFIVRRPIPDGTFEYWSLKDLEIIIY
tara:strand:- start:1132 stop:1875 length:744 start_codon:yes stop_codon:yes gene_type:complete